MSLHFGRSAARARAPLAAALLWLALASPALAGGEAQPGLSSADPSYWVGRYCTTSGCRDREATPLSHAAGFGAALIGIRWLAGRRPASR